MVSKKVLIWVSVIAAALMALNFYVSYNPNNFLTGFTGSSGYVNITVVAVLSVNFTTSSVNWGVGSINAGNNNASLITSGPSVLRGNWSTVGISGFVLENEGTLNVSLKVASLKNATSLFGGTLNHRAYMWNITNSDPSSCINDTISFYTWYDVNATSPGTQLCSQLGFLDNQDSLKIDTLITIPYDSNNGSISDTITATAIAS